MPQSATPIRKLPAKGGTMDRAALEPLGESAFRLLVEAVVDYAIFLLGPDGTVLSWNLGAERMKGYRRDEIVGRHFSTFYTPEDAARGRPQRNLAAAAADGRCEDEGWRLRKDGTRFWADVTITALREPGGELFGFAKVTRDVTDRRDAAEREKRLAVEQRARKAAEEALRSRDWFLKVASHELKTPVASLQVATEALLHARRLGKLDDRRLDASLGRIEAASKRLGVLVSELLDVSRLESGSVPLSRERVDVAGLVSEVVDSFAEHGGEDRVVLDAEPGVAIEADPARLDQVLANLIDNALKYSSDQVKVRIARQDGGVQLAVSDSGVGLDERAREMLFEPFARGSDVGHIPGMGLGLYISRQIVERHGGRISADSGGPQAGTTFSVWLPSTPKRHGARS